MIILENQIINYIGLGSRADLVYYRGTKAEYQIRIADKDFDTTKQATITLYYQKHGEVIKVWQASIPVYEYIQWNIEIGDLVDEKPLNYFIDCVYEGELLFYGNFELL